MRQIAGIGGNGREPEDVSLPPMSTILSGMDLMMKGVVNRMGGHRLSAEQVNGIKLGIDRALHGRDPDVAMRCKHMVDSYAAPGRKAPDVTDLAKVGPKGLVGKATVLAGSVERKGGKLSQSDEKELFKDLNAIHDFLSQQAASDGAGADVKKARLEVQGRILDTVQTIRNHYKWARRSPEDMSALRATIVSSITDDALAEKCRALFGDLPETQPKRELKSQGLDPAPGTK